MLSDAFPPFSGEMKGAKTAAAEIRCSIRPPSQTPSLKIYTTDESQPFGVRGEEHLDVRIISMGNGSFH